MTLAQVLLAGVPQLDADDPAVLAAVADAAGIYTELDPANPLNFSGVRESKYISRAALLAA